MAIGGSDNPVIGYELLSHLLLEPGRYHLRLGAESTLHGKTGSDHTDVEVPDFSKGEVSLSGVVLSVTPNAISEPKGALQAVIPVVPTTRRDFSAVDRVTAFLRVYQGKPRGKTKAEPAALTARIQDANDRTVFHATETLGPDRLSAARAADYRVDLPIDRLPPGPYLLSIEAAAGRTSLRRDVRFIRH
jgi:hypothetical protein